MADVITFDPEQPSAKYAAWLCHVENGLLEIANTIESLRDTRTRVHHHERPADIPPDVLKAVLKNLAADLRDLQAAVCEFERHLSSRDRDGPPPSARV